MDIKSLVNDHLRKKGLSRISVTIGGILFGILAGSLVLIPRGVSPFDVIRHLFGGAFGNIYNFTDSLIYTIPLGFTGLAIVMSYKAGIFNIGGEGQLQLAAIATTMVGTSFAFLPSYVHVPLAILVGALVGGLWALLPGLLRAYKGFNEIVITMLLNYISILMVSYFVQGPIKEPGQYFPQSAKIVKSARLNFIIPGTRLHSGILIFLGMCVLVYFIIFKTTLGYKIRTAGLNPNAGIYAGIDVKKTLVLAMVLSGMIAGMAGSVEILGVHRRLMENFSPGYGYDAIAVALLGELNPFGVILSAFFFGAVRNGANSLQIATGVPVSFVYIIQAFAVLFVVGSTGLPRLIKRIKRRAGNVK